MRFKIYFSILGIAFSTNSFCSTQASNLSNETMKKLSKNVFTPVVHNYLFNSEQPTVSKSFSLYKNISELSNDEIEKISKYNYKDKLPVTKRIEKLDQIEDVIIHK